MINVEATTIPLTLRKKQTFSHKYKNKQLKLPKELTATSTHLLVTVVTRTTD